MLLKQQDKFKESTVIVLIAKSLSPAWLQSQVFGSSVDGRPNRAMDPEVFNQRPQSVRRQPV
jgi:hypothetical protein